jgi:hypothetical protein
MSPFRSALAALSLTVAAALSALPTLAAQEPLATPSPRANMQIRTKSLTVAES